MRRWLPLVVLGSGCERDPSVFGIWDLASMEVDGARQEEAGILEILDDSTMKLLLRYRWEGGFVPDADPRVISADTSATRNPDPLDDFQGRGETYVLFLEAFDAEFALVERDLSELWLEARSARYPTPGLPPLEAERHEVSMVWVR